MKSSRRNFLAAAAIGAASWRCASSAPDDGVQRYVRFERNGAVSYGLLDGETVRPFDGGLFGERQPTGDSFPLASVKLLYPCEPTKILALAGNYSDHLAEGAPLPDRPEPFYKPISSLVSPDEPIVLPPGSRDVHYEAEFVIVMGQRASKASEAEAGRAIFGYTCGNDVSERNWQNGSIDGPENKDLQWWRAKGSDTFSPLGPVIASGLDWMKSRLQLRLNGEVRQDTTLDHLIFKPAEVVSFISRYVTLLPGDLIYTGTTGRTKPMQAGDIAEVEIDGIGVLRNPVSA